MYEYDNTYVLHAAIRGDGVQACGIGENRDQVRSIDARPDRFRDRITA